MLKNSLMAFRFSGGDIELRNPINHEVVTDYAYIDSLKNSMEIASFTMGAQIASDVCLRGNEAKTKFFKYIKLAEGALKLTYVEKLDSLISSVKAERADYLFNISSSKYIGYGCQSFVESVKRKAEQVDVIDQEINKTIKKLAGLTNDIESLLSLCEELIHETIYVRTALWHKIRAYSKESDLRLENLEDWIDIVEGISFQFNCLSELESDLSTIHSYMMDLALLLKQFYSHPKMHKKRIISDFFNKICATDQTGFALNGPPNDDAFSVGVGGELVIDGGAAKTYLTRLREDLKSSSDNAEHILNGMYKVWFSDLPEMKEHRVRYLVKVDN